jgi:hypothetical protein
MTPLLAVSIYWHLPILIVVVSIIYSATRYDQWDLIFREAVRWGWRMTLFLGVIAGALFALSTFL